jgi:hypothetical protein
MEKKTRSSVKFMSENSTSDLIFGSAFYFKQFFTAKEANGEGGGSGQKE